MVVRVENYLRFAGDCVIAQNPSFGIWEHEVAGSNPVAPTNLANIDGDGRAALIGRGAGGVA